MSTRIAGDTLYVNLFAGGTADVDLAGGKLKIVQTTRYPWDGAVKMTVTPERARQFAINVRIPGWARERAGAERRCIVFSTSPRRQRRSQSTDSRCR